MREPKNFETGVFYANPLIDDSTYLATFLSWWLCEVFALASTIVRPETFFMAVDMLKGTCYTFVVPHLARL